MRAVVLILLIGALPACFDYSPPDTVFMCDADDIKCTSNEARPGHCLSDGAGNWFCAIDVIGCPTGLRWSMSAAHSLRDKCVTQAYLNVQPRADGGAVDAQMQSFSDR